MHLTQIASYLRSVVVIAASALVLGLGASPVAAQNLVESFDSQPCLSKGTAMLTPLGGLNWTATCADAKNHKANIGLDSGFGASVASGNNVVYNAFSNPVVLTRDGGGVFTVQSGMFTSVWRDSLILKVEGFLGGVSVSAVMATLQVTGPIQVSLASLGSVDQVKITASGGTAHKGFFDSSPIFALDDLTYALPTLRMITGAANPPSGGSVVCQPSIVTDGGAASCTATAALGYTFESFTGCTSVSSNVCTLGNVVANATVVANFSTVPSQPASPIATADNAQATVSWVPPNDGGSAIAGYTVVADQDASKTCIGGVSDIQCTVTGLTNGKPYSFTVTAANANGPGLASPSSNVVTPQFDPLVIAVPATVPPATVGKAYQLQLRATGGSAPYTWAATGLPAGLSIDNTGLISGTPTDTKSAAITTKAALTATITVTDSLAVQATQTLSLTVNAAAVTATATPVPTLHHAALALLSLMAAGFGALALRSRKASGA